MSAHAGRLDHISPLPPNPNSAAPQGRPAIVSEMYQHLSYARVLDEAIAARRPHPRRAPGRVAGRSHRTDHHSGRHSPRSRSRPNRQRQLEGPAHVDAGDFAQLEAAMDEQPLLVKGYNGPPVINSIWGEWRLVCQLQATTLAADSARSAGRRRRRVAGPGQDQQAAHGREPPLGQGSLMPQPVRRRARRRGATQLRDMLIAQWDHTMRQWRIPGTCTRMRRF
jgi:hypothetical protein